MPHSRKASNSSFTNCGRSAPAAASVWAAGYGIGIDAPLDATGSVQIATTIAAITAVVIQPNQRNRTPITWALRVALREASNIITAMIGRSRPLGAGCGSA